MAQELPLDTDAELGWERLPVFFGHGFVKWMASSGCPPPQIKELDRECLLLTPNVQASPRLLPCKDFSTTFVCRTRLPIPYLAQL